VVVEGYFDCLSLHQAGIENVVASCGTSLTQQQVGIMARYVPEVVMNYDPDAAGGIAQGILSGLWHGGVVYGLTGAGLGYIHPVRKV